MELASSTTRSEATQNIVVALRSNEFFGAELIPTPGYLGYGLLNTVQLNSGSSYPNSYIIGYGNTCIRDKGLNTATLNSSLLSTGLCGNCIVQEGGNKATSNSSGKLLVTGDFRINGRAFANSSGNYKVTAHLVSINNTAITNSASAVLIERNLALEECRMLQVPHYPNTMYSIKSVKDTGLKCN